MRIANDRFTKLAQISAAASRQRTPEVADADADTDITRGQ